MARLTIVYHNDGTKTIGRARAYGLDDSERLAIEGSQGDRIMRGYRDLESQGYLRRERMKDSPAVIKSAWADEQTSRFK